MTGWAVGRKIGAAFAGPGSGFVAIGTTFGTSGPGLEGGEYIAEQRPDEREIGDEDGDGGFAEVPVHVDVGNQRWDETVDLVEDGGDNDEDSHTEEQDEDELLLEWDADLH